MSVTMNPDPLAAEERKPQPDLLISTQGIVSYLICNRQWWLSEHLEYDLSDEYAAAQERLSQRQKLSERLTLIGASMIGLALVIIAISLIAG